MTITARRKTRLMGHADNYVVIYAPIGFVWARTNDLRSWTDLFTEYASVEILSEEPGRIRFRLTTHPGSFRAPSGNAKCLRYWRGPLWHP